MLQEIGALFLVKFSVCFHRPKTMCLELPGSCQNFKSERRWELCGRQGPGTDCSGGGGFCRNHGFAVGKLHGLQSKTDNLAEASEQVVLLEEYFPAGDQEQKDIVIEA